MNLKEYIEFLNLIPETINEMSEERAKQLLKIIVTLVKEEKA